ncbi:hypothetical protein PZV05_000241 [Salmonella enterica]|nr:hypothetical protein [Salmonella enterica]
MAQQKKQTEHNIATPEGVVKPCPELQQMHFVLQDNYHVFLLSLEDILLCLREAEKHGEVPHINDVWWGTLQIAFPRLR